MKAKTKFTRLWSILLALAMVVSMLPTMVLAAESESADFVSDPTTALALLNAAKTDGADDSTWDADSKTLTLNGVDFTTTAVDAVHLPGGTTIVLTGVNTITGGPAVTDVNGGWCCGIRVEGDLTISGTGSLTVTGGDASATYGVSAGIFSNVNTAGGSTVRITGGTVEAKGGPARQKSYGILAGWGKRYGNVVIKGDAQVTAIGGDMVNNDGYTAGIRANSYAGGGTLTISDRAIVTAKAGNNGLYCEGLVAIISVSVSGNAQLTAEGGNSGRSIGIASYSEVNISGNARVTATGKEAYFSAGISGTSGIEGGRDYIGQVNISDNAQVTATGGNAGDQSYGIMVIDLNISDSAQVIAKAGVVTYAPNHYWSGSCGNAGIYSTEEVNISGSAQVTAMAALVYDKFGNVDETDSRGGINRAINISGGIVTAAGYKNDCSAAFQDAGGYKNSFNANGGKGMMSFTKATAGTYAGYTLPANGFIAPVGKQFKCWEVDGTEKTVGETINIAEDTTVTAIWEAIEYNVTVTGGTASVGAGTPITKATMGTTVTLTAGAAPSGQMFDKWVVENGDITLADATSATTTFTMPAGEVSVKATYKDAPHTHTFDQKTIKDAALKTAADCTHDAVYYKSCSCGAISTNDADTFADTGSALGHAWPEEGSWSKDADKHWYECSRCGARTGESEHTLDEKGKCTECGFKKIILADVSGDGQIDTIDLTFMRKYLSGYTVEMNVAAADLNGDGKVDTIDLTLMRKYLAGYEVIFAK